MRPNVFSDVLKPSPDRTDLTALQLELHSRTSRVLNQYKLILNSMRVIGVFDWLLATKDFLAISLEDPFKKGLLYSTTCVCGVMLSVNILEISGSLVV